MNELRQYFFRGNQIVITYEDESRLKDNAFDQWFGSTTSSFKLYEIKDGVKSVKTPSNLKCVKTSGVNAVLGVIQSDGSGGYKVNINSDINGTFSFQWQCDEIKSPIFTVTINPRSQIVDTGNCVLDFTGTVTNGNISSSAVACGGDGSLTSNTYKNHGSMTTEVIHDRVILDLAFIRRSGSFSPRATVYMKMKGNTPFTSKKIKITFPEWGRSWTLNWAEYGTGVKRYEVGGGTDLIDWVINHIYQNNHKSWVFKIDLL